MQTSLCHVQFILGSGPGAAVGHASDVIGKFHVAQPMPNKGPISFSNPTHYL